MGREIKRVPMDFGWPVNEIWGGYKNPFYSQSVNCPDCGGHGSSPQAKRLSDQWYGNAPFRPEDRGSVPWKPTDKEVLAAASRNESNRSAIKVEAIRLCYLFNGQWMHHLNDADVASLVKANRLYDFTHVFVPGEGWTPKEPPYVPTAKEVNAASLTAFLLHDSISNFVCVEAECERLGYPMHCSRCAGKGCLWPTPEIEKQRDDWMCVEPPAGHGYQLWETVSEGSPISPVFATPEELADWLTTSPEYQWRTNDQKITREQWLSFIRGPGWAPSMIIKDGVVKNGVQGVV